MPYWHVGETDEWITDQALAESGMEQGMDITEYDEDSLVGRIKYLENQLSEQREAVTVANRTIMERLVELHNADHSFAKNIQATYIAEDLRQLRRKFGL